LLQKELAREQGLVPICAGTPIRATGNGWMRYRDDYANFRELIYQRNIIYQRFDIHGLEHHNVIDNATFEHEEIR
jgi:hypothetical protein